MDDADPGGSRRTRLHTVKGDRLVAIGGRRKVPPARTVPVNAKSWTDNRNAEAIRAGMGARKAWGGSGVM